VSATFSVDWSFDKRTLPYHSQIAIPKRVIERGKERERERDGAREVRHCHVNVALLAKINLKLGASLMRHKPKAQHAPQSPVSVGPQRAQLIKL